MSGIFASNTQEERGAVATTAEADRLAIVIGVATAATGLSPFYLSGASAKSGCGNGDAVDLLCHIIEQPQTNGTSAKYPAAMVRCAAATNGSYDTIDTTGVLGTAVVTVDAASHPLGTYQGYWRCTQGGIIGVDGIELVHSLDDGRNTSEVYRLGTASDFSIPNSGIRFLFNPTAPNLTALNTLIDDLFTQANDHFVLTADNVHGTSDAAHVMSAVTYPAATNTATRIARVNAIRAAYEAHRNTMGSVHGAVDVTNAVTSPAATSDATALALALNLRVVFAAHIINVTAAVHGSADTTNTITAPIPVAGSVLAGDIVRVRTNPPAPSLAAIDAAFVALAASSLDFRLVFIECPGSLAIAEHAATGRNVLLASGKRAKVFFRVRDRVYNTGSAETDAEWMASISTEYRTFRNSGVFMFAAYGLIKDPTTSNRYIRSFFAQFAADVIRVPRKTMPNVPADQPMANCSLIDDAGNLIGHDEGVRGTSTGLSNDAHGNRFISVMRLADPKKMEDVHSTVPWCAYSSDEKIRTLPERRIADAMLADAVSAGNAMLGGDVRYYPATQTESAKLNEISVRAVHKQVFSVLSANFENDIDNAKDAALDTGLVQINPNITVLPGNMVRIGGTLRVRMFLYILELNFTLSIQT